jgi:hypothetical protein
LGYTFTEHTGARCGGAKNPARAYSSEICYQE